MEHVGFAPPQLHAARSSRSAERWQGQAVGASAGRGFTNSSSEIRSSVLFSRGVPVSAHWRRRRSRLQARLDVGLGVLDSLRLVEDHEVPEARGGRREGLAVKSARSVS